ncbi:MAG: hypothetical protein AAGG51_00070 [Cyanobacteria bacterium P01_G01_bin.54]
MLPINLLPGAVPEILADAAETQVLTQHNRLGLLVAILAEDLPAEEHRAIDRLLYAVKRGRITLQ